MRGGRMTNDEKPRRNVEALTAVGVIKEGLPEAYHSVFEDLSNEELAVVMLLKAGLVEYLERHIPEEMHSEEPGGATLDDLAALGVDTAALRTQQPSPKIAALIGAVYYWIFHFHPVAVLGYLELEAYHPNVSGVE